MGYILYIFKVGEYLYQYFFLLEVNLCTEKEAIFTTASVYFHITCMVSVYVSLKADTLHRMEP